MVFWHVFLSNGIFFGNPRRGDYLLVFYQTEGENANVSPGAWGLGLRDSGKLREAFCRNRNDFFAQPLFIPAGLW